MSEKKRPVPQEDLPPRYGDAALPHGREENIKIELLGLIHRAENPYIIIDRLASYLEETSAEAGYAAHVRADIRTIYGFALGETRLVADELHDVESRLARIEQSRKEFAFTAEENARIGYAIAAHKENIGRLKTLLQRLEENRAEL